MSDGEQRLTKLSLPASASAGICACARSWTRSSGICMPSSDPSRAAALDLGNPFYSVDWDFRLQPAAQRSN